MRVVLRYSRAHDFEEESVQILRDHPWLNFVTHVLYGIGKADCEDLGVENLSDPGVGKWFKTTRDFCGPRIDANLQKTSLFTRSPAALPSE